MTHKEQHVWKVQCVIYFSTNKNSVFAIEGRNVKGGDHAEIDAIKKYKDQVSKLTDGEKVVHVSAAVNLPCCENCAKALCDIGIERIDGIHSSEGCIQVAQIKWIDRIRLGVETFEKAGVNMTTSYQNMIMTEDQQLWVKEFLDEKREVPAPRAPLRSSEALDALSQKIIDEIISSQAVEDVQKL